MAPDHQLDSTLTDLAGDLAAISPGAATATIDRWVARLNEAGLPQIADTLTDLRAALAGGTPDGMTIGPLLTRLGTQTSDVSDNADPDTAEMLQRLASLLTAAGGRMH